MENQFERLLGSTFEKAGAFNIVRIRQRLTQRFEESGMDAEERKKNSSEVTVEEWSGSSSSKLSRTATITSLSIRRFVAFFSTVLHFRFSFSFSLHKPNTYPSFSSVFAPRRSGSRFSHVWRRILQAFVPEASALSFFFGARLGFWIDLIEYLDFLKLGHCSENDFLALGSE